MVLVFILSYKQEEVMALPGECRLQQVKCEMLSETDTLEASSNNPSSGRAKGEMCTF